MEKTGKVLVLVIALIMSMSLAFAGGESEKVSDGESGITEISFMWWGNETRNAATTKAGEDFMADNPDVRVSFMPNPFDGYHDKILVQLANGTAADLFCYSTQWMCEAGFAENPVLFDINQVADYIDLSTIEEKLLRGGMEGNKLLGVPTGISGFTFCYYENAIDAYVKKSGQPLPQGMEGAWTLDEFLEYGRKFHDTMGDDYYFLDFGGDISGFTNFFIYLLSEEAGAFYVDEKCQMQFTEDDLKKTIDLLLEMTNTGIIAAAPFQYEMLSGVSTRDRHLAEGKFATVFMWTSNTIENATKADSECITMAYPQIGRPENTGVFVRPAQFWSISARSKHPETAARLLDYLLNSPKAAVDLGLERSVPPTATGRKALSDAGLLTGTIYEGTNYVVEKAGASYNWFIMIPEVIDGIANSWVNVLLGKTTSEKGAADLYSKISEITATMRAENNL